MFIGLWGWCRSSLWSEGAASAFAPIAQEGVLHGIDLGAEVGEAEEDIDLVHFLVQLHQFPDDGIELLPIGFGIFQPDAQGGFHDRSHVVSPGCSDVDLPDVFDISPGNESGGDTAWVVFEALFIDPDDGGAEDEGLKGEVDHRASDGADDGGYDQAWAGEFEGVICFAEDGPSRDAHQEEGEDDGDQVDGGFGAYLEGGHLGEIVVLTR